jgi:hypothetical protein
MGRADKLEPDPYIYLIYGTVRLLEGKGGMKSCRMYVYEKLTRPRVGPPARAAGRPASARQATDETRSQPDQRLIIL